MIDEKLFEKVKLKIAISNCKMEIKQREDINIPQKQEKRRLFNMKKKIIATVCASFILISGIVVATNVEKIKTHFRGLGEGVDTAVENGYIATPNAEEVDSNVVGTNKETKIEVDNMTAKINIENFLMDDINLSTQISLEFDDKLKDIVDLDAVSALELTDLIIRDEENRIIYGGNDEERFKKYCEENNLNYTFTEFNDNYMNCGVNCFNVSHDKENNSITIMYNMYAGNFPKSKKLYFSFGKIEMLEYDETKDEQNKVIINGNWEILVDVPAEMYNRTAEYYKVVSCDNDDFEVYTAKVTDTGFELGVIISNIEEPEYDEEKYLEFGKLSNEYYNGKISLEEYKDIFLWEMERIYLNNPISISDTIGRYIDKKSIPSYVENETKNKFECSMNPNRKVKNNFMEGNKFDFYETFSMTQYDATDKIKVVLYYYGEPINIELEKIKN